MTGQREKRIKRNLDVQTWAIKIKQIVMFVEMVFTFAGQPIKMVCIRSFCHLLKKTYKISSTNISSHWSRNKPSTQVSNGTSTESCLCPTTLLHRSHITSNILNVVSASWKHMDRTI